MRPLHRPPGRPLGGLRFIGASNGRLNLGRVAALDGLAVAGAFTLLVLQRWYGTLAAQNLVAKENGSSLGWRFGVSASGQLSGSIRGTAAGTYTSTATVVADLQPKWAIFTYDSTLGSSKGKLFSRPLAGALVAEGLATNTDPTTPGNETTFDILLGERTTSGLNTAPSADVFLVAIANRAMLFEEIDRFTQNPMAMRGRVTGLWLLGPNGPGVVADHSGSGMHASAYQGTVVMAPSGIVLPMGATTPVGQIIAGGASPFRYRPILGLRAA